MTKDMDGRVMLGRELQPKDVDGRVKASGSDAVLWTAMPGHEDS
jgi:hypothetical protein